MVDITLILMIKEGIYIGGMYILQYKKDILISWMSFQVNLFAQYTKSEIYLIFSSKKLRRGNV